MRFYMVDMVTGAASVIGFTNDDHHNGHNGYNYGITGKDALFAHSIDQSEQTRDVLSAIADGITAVEKTGAANSLAVEKVGAAGVLESAKGTAALHIQIANAAAASAAIAAANQQAAMMYANTNASAAVLLATQNQAAMAAQLAECCCDIKKDIAGVTATILATDAARIRDDLNMARNELLALRIAAGGGAAAAALARGNS